MPAGTVLLYVASVKEAVGNEGCDTRAHTHTHTHKTHRETKLPEAKKSFLSVAAQLRTS